MVSNDQTPAGNAPKSPEQRRGSQSGTLFSGLMQQKRNSVDAQAAARRQSFNDMKPQGGIFGQMWNNFTRGSGSPEAK